MTVSAGGYATKTLEVTVRDDMTLDVELERIYPGFPSATGTISGGVDYNARNIFQGVTDAGQSNECYGSHSFPCEPVRRLVDQRPGGQPTGRPRHGEESREGNGTDARPHRRRPAL